MDICSPAKRSEVMSRIRGRDTKPELIVRSLLHRSGVRYSLQRKDLPGRPDIVMPRHGVAVFVHGCFWHRHRGCPVATMPKSRVAFWEEKFARNVARDRRTLRTLRALGWKVIVVWECQVLKNPFAVLRRILRTIRPEGVTVDYERLPDRRTLLRVAEERLQWNLRKRAGD